MQTYALADVDQWLAGDPVDDQPVDPTASPTDRPRSSSAAAESLARIAQLGGAGR